MLSSPKQPGVVVPQPAVVKRRRKSGKGQGDSSREASAESNDETATDNDPMADDTDTASVTSPRLLGNPIRPRNTFEDHHHPHAPSHRLKRPPTLAAAATMNSSMTFLDKETNSIRLDAVTHDTSVESGLESGASTYDGDVSSAPGPANKRGSHGLKHLAYTHLHQSDASSDSRRGSAPGSSLSQMSWALDQAVPDEVSAGSSKTGPNLVPPSSTKNLAPGLPPAPHGLLSRLAAEELQANMQEAIRNPNDQRSYSINPPPTGRPVRIYADGVYDLFHYGHALQLRQCKLFFPEVYLMVGVCPDEMVRKYKASPVLSSAERYESVANCKWVDEVIEDAPWQVDRAFMDKHQIDYVAHDEEPYASLDSDDVYGLAKSLGRFLPTRRTDGVSTSELLQRIVGGYVEGVYDNKLEKIGASELCSNRAFSDAGSGAHRGGGARTPMVAYSPHVPTDAEMDDGTATVSEGV